VSETVAKHSAWYTAACRAQTEWKERTATLTAAARQPGTCFVDKNGKRAEVGPYSVCLPLPFADRNLLPSIRALAVDRFARHDVEWHAWSPGPSSKKWPSGHLLDSQVQCANILLSLAAQPPMLLDLVREIEAGATDLVSIEDGSPVTFEWIGADDYVGEARGRRRHRGRFCTSADALFVVQRRDGRTAILVEWKFTETYPHPVSARGPGGTDRRDVYGAAYQTAYWPLSVRPPIDAFLQEPHYQLFRQALMAAGMVEAGEHGIDRAILLHVVPARNTALRAITTPRLSVLGNSVEAIWRQLLPGPRVTYHCMDSLPLMLCTPEIAERYGMLAGRPPQPVSA
jgi:hypothetical protein